MIGAIAGGPVGAAAGLALQALLRDALGDATEAKYIIRGPWADPLVEPVEKKPTSNGAGGAPAADEQSGTEAETDQQIGAGAAGQQSTDDENYD